MFIKNGNVNNNLMMYVWLSLYYVYFVLSMSPWFSWSDEVKFLNYFLSIFIFLFTLVLLLGKHRYNKDDLNIFALLFILIIWTFLPIRENDSLKITIILQLSIISFILQSNVVKFKVIRLFYNYYSAANILFIFLWVLYFLGVPSPDIIIANGDRDNSNFYYKFYYGVVFLNSQTVNVGSLDFFRNHGFFEEPGHLGIFNLLFLCVFRNKTSELKYKICVLSTVLTFSLPALVGLGVLLISSKAIKLKTKLSFILIVVSFIFIFSQQLLAIYSSTIGYKLERGNTIQEVLDSRTMDLNRLPDARVVDVIIGFGREVFVKHNIVVGDYRSILYKYGLLYYVFLLLIIYYIGSKRGFDLDFMCFFIVTLIILIQRSWFLDTSAYILFLCIFYIIGTNLKLNGSAKNGV